MEQPSIVLIVDDEPIGRATLEGLLRHHGYQLAFAANGQEALAQAATLMPDLILLDVMMPHMDGYEVCRRLRNNVHLADIPVIMITALDDRESRVRGIEAGADDYIGKPFDRVELRTRVSTITRLNRHRRIMAERARFEWVVEHTDEGYLVINNHARLVYANPQARRYLGLAQGEMVSGDFFQLIEKQYVCEPRDAWEQWRNKSGDLAGRPLYLIHPETNATQTFWLEIDSHDFPNGSDGQRLIRLRNVTSQVNYQRDMWKFHSMVTHKLRTPFIGISSLQILGQHAKNMSPDEIAEFSQMVADGAERLRSSIEDILQYISIPGIVRQAGKCPLNLIENLVQELNNGEQFGAISVAYQPGLEDVQLPVHPQGLDLILRELLENAKKFHPSHEPTIEIMALRGSGNNVLIQVRDNGTTLSPEQLSQVWVPYYQGEKYFTGEVSGMGLGLPMIASLLWSVGGSCNMRNREDGPGVIIEMRIPIARERTPESAAA